MGHIPDTSLNELSDFVASTDNPGVFWTEEDSGNPNNVYAVTGTGQIVGVFTIQGTKDIDWEDLAIDRQAGTDFLYVGDIGDNKGTRDGSNTTGRSRVRLYRFPEPTVSATGPKVTGTITRFDTFVYQYADANGTPIAPRNSESLMVDPITPRRLHRREEGADDREREAELGVPPRPAASERRDQHRAQGRDHDDGEVLRVRRHLAVAATSPSRRARSRTSGRARTTATVEATINAHPAAPCTASPLIASEAIGWAPDGLWMVPDGTVPAPVVRLAFAP